MRNSLLPTNRTNVVLAKRVWSLLCVLALGCAERERAPMVQSNHTSAPQAAPSACASPSPGCPCDEPGKLVDCGEVVERTDEYVTCMQGVRICTDAGSWGECGGDLVTKATPPSSDKTILALGLAAGCSDQNPCDPLCRQIVDTGVGLANIPEGLCSTASGIGVCPRCGYAGPTADMAYATMPDEWRRIPATCSPADDHCPIDTVCVGNACQTRALPCKSASGTCTVDLTVGKPCIDGNGNYHIPLCNRGSLALSSGTIRIGADSRSAAMTECTPIAATDALEGFPDGGRISFTLAVGQSIDPGTCVDVNPSNSQAEALDLSVNRAFVVNYDAGIAECNQCNNGSVVIVSSETSDISRCTSCVNLECNQTNIATTLRGVVYDPAGVRPLPNAVVYVPNGEVAAFIDGVACDTCESLIRGSPLVATTTDATGHFTLTRMPSEKPFPLVVQIGRWRRQVTVAPIAGGQTRWIHGYSQADGRFTLSTDALEPTPVDAQWRLRLPRTQRRCTSSGCAGDGDIPQMALIMGDADPLQCVLRRVGIADSEFTSEWNVGRVHLFEALGMWHSGSRSGIERDDALLKTSESDGQPMLSAYSLLLAPCDSAYDETEDFSETYQSSPVASGPSYNAWPGPATDPQERAVVRDFVDAGGRLLTTHWMSMDFVHLNYDAPESAGVVNADTGVSLDSPYDPSSDRDFASAVSAYAASTPGFRWNFSTPETYNPSAPALYLFGNNVEAGSPRSHDPALVASERFAPLGYDIDQSTGLGATFAAWATVVGATVAGGSGRLRWREWSPMVGAVRPERGVIPLLVGDSRDTWRFDATSDPLAKRAGPVPQQPCLQGDGSAYDCSTGRTWGDQHVAMFQFDAPLDADQQCGRVGVATGHVSQHACLAPSSSRDVSHCEQVLANSLGSPTPDCECFEFPKQAELACGTSEMSEEERAFEYLLFSVSQCMGPLSRKAQTAPVTQAVMIRDFEADCTEGEQVVWQLFSWRATVPTGTRIEFYGGTADTETDLAAASFVQIGVADATTTIWTAGNHTVDEYFRQNAAAPDVSRRWLRAKIAFVPNGLESPTLSEWRVVFNCIKNE